ncbi:4-oxalocrotonate tautomerase [Lipingzhangella halophila]|uniref:4-oxalocrotonate tautomerase n=1 Tax=Lipingzhangella halophila TaxID=1783352 RepID=A0A7W7RK91_9ACTN|nr:tautomerase family protein [Lipingzhangella halophila]MBB4933527.1 4-oxalocrotonate tautomerase [Lipingzhangella halophila]
MPQVDITLAGGRTPSQVRNLMREVHAAVVRTADARPEHVRVVVHEVPRTHWAIGDVTLAEMDAVNETGTTAGPQNDSAATGRLADTAHLEQQ